MPIRSILAGAGGYLPEHIVAMMNWRGPSILQTNGSANAPASASAISPDLMKPRPSWGPKRRGRRWPMRKPAAGGGRGHPRHQHPRSGISLHRHEGDGHWASGGFGFDLSAACAGFIYALSVADGMIRAGQARAFW